MTKDLGAFRTIGELSKELNIKPHILRYWEEQFGMLRPLKRAGSRRHYRPGDVEMVKTINRLLNEEGYTIKGARKFLASRQKQPAVNASQDEQPPLKAENPGVDNSLILKELKIIRDQLSNALSKAG
ncbi:MerR family transcriptional regulator [Parasphingorhabdus sp. JC815]|uniref:MerR family transcriptional regulator n=1 Tax=Parasphingorhabdus sp. JC815 TaxID=3232140 RepID=UPI003458BDBB